MPCFYHVKCDLLGRYNSRSLYFQTIKLYESTATIEATCLSNNVVTKCFEAFLQCVKILTKKGCNFESIDNYSDNFV